MKKASLFFEIELNYQPKYYSALINYGNYKYSKQKKKYIWLFGVKDMKKVLSILGKPIEFDKKEGDIVAIYVNNIKKEIREKQKQGEGFINVNPHPTKPSYFVVTTVREKQPINTNVSFETVKALWNVIQKQPLNKKILTHTIAENYCKELNIGQFNTYTGGNFNWKYFSGSRKYYLIFYAALKILAYYGVIEHIVEASKSGIKRTKNNWSLQTEL